MSTPGKVNDDRTEVVGDPPITEILEQLEYVDLRFPLELLQTVVRRKKEAIPHLLYVLEEAKRQSDILEEDDGYILHIFAMYLLAQFRERKAYPLIIDFFSLPGEKSMEMTGDVGTQDLHRILTTVSGGEAGPIQSLIENREINEWVRRAATESLVGMVLNDMKPRSEIIAYLKSLFDGRVPRDPYDDIWGGLVNAALDLNATELRPDIERAFDDDLVDPQEVCLEDVSYFFRLNLQPEHQSSLRRTYALVNDIADEMKWANWKADPRLGPKRFGNRKIDKHAPCPCGSGRMYKKCCGQVNTTK